MSNERRIEKERATEELASAVQPTHYNVTPHDEGAAQNKAEPASKADSAEESTPGPPAAGAHGAGVSAEPPVETSGIEIKEMDRAAGGIPAVVSTLKHSLREMGVRRSLKTLLA